MSNRGFEDLIAMKSKKVPSTHAGYIPAGSYTRPGMYVPKAMERRVVRHIVRAYTPSLAELRPARGLVIQGEPGIGKTEGALVAISRNRCDAVLVNPSAELSGEAEGAPVAGFKRIEAFVAAKTAETQGVIAVVFDDVDMVAGRESHTTVTINQSLLLQYWQHLLDGHGMCSSGGVPVPIIATGNSFSSMRGSAVRGGRCEVFSYALEVDEKIKVVAALFAGGEEKMVRHLVKAHGDRPIAFFQDVRVRLIDEAIDALIVKHGIELAQIDREVRRAGIGKLIDTEVVMRTAEAVAAEHVGRFV